MKVINDVLDSKVTYLSILIDNIDTVLNENRDKRTVEIDGNLEGLQNELLRLANSKKDYDGVAEEIYRLRELKQDVLVENAEREGVRQRIEEMTNFLKGQTHQLEAFNDPLIRRLIEKVTVHENYLTIEFKSGIEKQIEM